MLDPKQLAAKLAPGREIYEHDELHELVAYGAAPIYTTLKTDPAKAMLSRTRSAHRAPTASSLAMWAERVRLSIAVDIRINRKHVRNHV